MQETISPIQHQRLGYSVKELSKLVGISERKLWDEIKTKKLAASRIGRRVVIQASEIDKWLTNASF